ncbi:hypothetical protein JKP88DRAFT_251483 [Tribonema minus]|uniref:Uncharacterized protein n=1 Tax=Tribonema minus TaxID=303371 RepID=A0A835ZBS7_9STRA|nr:hypothetical protein JKP88DRAFT_251483 [Tribonema minus]
MTSFEDYTFSDIEIPAGLLGEDSGPAQGEKRRHAELQPSPANNSAQRRRKKPRKKKRSVTTGGAPPCGEPDGAPAAHPSAPPAPQEAIPLPVDGTQPARIVPGGLHLVTPRAPPVNAPLSSELTRPVVCKSLFPGPAAGLLVMDQYLKERNDWTPHQHDVIQEIYKLVMPEVKTLKKKRRRVARKITKKQKVLARFTGQEHVARSDIITGLQKDLDALDADLREKTFDASDIVMMAVNLRPHIHQRWMFLAHDANDLEDELGNYPASIQDPRGDDPHPSPLDLLASIDLHGQSGGMVEHAFMFPEMFLQMYGWAAVIPGRGAHTRELTKKQIKKGAKSPLQKRMLEIAAVRGVGVASFSSSPGVLLVFTHELYQQAIDLNIRFQVPTVTPGTAA